MPYFRKRPITIQAHHWFRNGDHPEDFSDRNPEMSNIEGMVVRYYRRHDVPGNTKCKHCGRAMYDHGWIDTLEGGHIVCPGDWIITGLKGEHYPCKPDVFSATYEPVAYEAVDKPAPAKPVDDAMVERAQTAYNDAMILALGENTDTMTEHPMRAALVAALEGRT